MRQQQKRPGRPRLPERERVQTVGATLDWYQRRAIELEAERLGRTPTEHRREKLLRGLEELVADLRAGRAE